MADKSVIQTNLREHGLRAHDLINADVAFRRLAGGLTEDQLHAYEMAAFLYWNHCTASIVREGNCRFESED